MDLVFFKVLKKIMKRMHTYAKWRARGIQYGLIMVTIDWQRGRQAARAGSKPGQAAISNRYLRKHRTALFQDELINLPLNSRPSRNCAFQQTFAHNSCFIIVLLHCPLRFEIFEINLVSIHNQYSCKHDKT